METPIPSTQNFSKHLLSVCYVPSTQIDIEDVGGTPKEMLSPDESRTGNKKKPNNYIVKYY